MATAVEKITMFFGIVTAALALTTIGAAQNETTKIDPLVGATAELQHTIDAKTARQGDTVTAKLRESVHTSDGTKLPRNTQLIGHIDEVQPSENKGLSKIVLTFDQARLANGRQIAIKATIIGIYPAGTEGLPSLALSADLKVHQLSSDKHGYALNSSVADSNSGTLSADGKDVRVGAQTELQFAFAPGPGIPLTSAGR